MLTVIIINYNAGDYLLQCVQSVLKSTIVQKIFIVDNGSTDHSLPLLEHELATESRLTILKNGRNFGFSRANNIAVLLAQTEYLLFLNPDCIVQPQALERMFMVLQQHPQAGMAGCLIRNADGSVQGTCIRHLPNPLNAMIRLLHLERFFQSSSQVKHLDAAKAEADLPKTVMPVEAISGACMLVRKSALDQVGLLDETYFLYGEDLDWMMRFKQAKWQILFVPEAEIVHFKGVCGRSIPIRVWWYKAQAMQIYYRKFLRQQHSWLLRGFIYTGIWLRFAIMALLSIIHLKGGS